MLPLAVNLIAIGLVLPLLVDALARAFDTASPASAGETVDTRGPVPSGDLDVWFALALLAVGASLLSADLARQTSLHYQGAAFLTLTLGYSRALLTAGVVAAATSPPSLLGLSLFVDAVVPVWLTCALVAASRRHLPPNPFVFLLGCGFFGLFLIGTAQLLLSVGAAELFPVDAGGGATALAPSERLVWGLLLLGGEVTLEGMLITVLVVYAPRAVSMFDDRFYLATRS